MSLATADRRALIQLIVAYAAEKRGAVSKIRLIKLLYLADVHAFQRTQQTLTGYRWRFYHYGPWALEAQAEIDECATEGLIERSVLPKEDEVGEVTLYRLGRGVVASPPGLSATVEMLLRRDIAQWLDQPLPLFLDYIYFDTPPMRGAKRGEYLKFDAALFPPTEEPRAAPKRRYSSRESRRTFEKLLEQRAAHRERVAVPRDAIADDAYRAALEQLDAQDWLSGSLEGRATTDPKSID